MAVRNYLRVLNVFDVGGIQQKSRSKSPLNRGVDTPVV